MCLPGCGEGDGVGGLSAGLLAIAAGIAVRQADRWWFSPARGRRHGPESLRSVMALQRERLNNVTPVLLLMGHWLEFAGWCAVAVHGGPWGWAVAALAGAVSHAISRRSATSRCTVCWRGADG